MTRIASGMILAPPARAWRTQKREEEERSFRNGDNQSCFRDKAVTMEGMVAPTAKLPGRHTCSLHRTGSQSFGDAELIASVRAYGVVGHQLVGHLLRERGNEPPANVDRGQLLMLALIVCAKFRALKREVGLFGVTTPFWSTLP